MPSRRFGPRLSKRPRILGKQLAPIQRPEAMTYTRCSNAPATIADIWIFLLGYYGSFLVITLELLILTIAGVLLHILLILRLCRRNIPSPLPPVSSGIWYRLWRKGWRNWRNTGSVCRSIRRNWRNPGSACRSIRSIRRNWRNARNVCCSVRRNWRSTGSTCRRIRRNWRNTWRGDGVRARREICGQLSRLFLQDCQKDSSGSGERHIEQKQSNNENHIGKKKNEKPPAIIISDTKTT